MVYLPTFGWGKLVNAGKYTHTCILWDVNDIFKRSWLCLGSFLGIMSFPVCVMCFLSECEMCFSNSKFRFHVTWRLTTFCPPEGWDEQQWLMKAQDLLKSYGIDPCLGNLSWKSFTSPKTFTRFLDTDFFVENLMTITWNLCGHIRKSSHLRIWGFLWLLHIVLSIFCWEIWT